MARNKLLHHYRDRKSLSDLSEVGESRLVDLEPSPSSHVGHRQRERLLIEALRRLPLDYQLVIELYAWERLTGPEVALVLDITEAAMRSRLHRAKQALRRELEALGESGEALETTMANLDKWARDVRPEGGGAEGPRLRIERQGSDTAPEPGALRLAGPSVLRALRSPGWLDDGCWWHALRRSGARRGRTESRPIAARTAVRRRRRRALRAR